jgi:hypothetical protein
MPCRSAAPAAPSSAGTHHTRPKKRHLNFQSHLHLPHDARVHSLPSPLWSLPTLTPLLPFSCRPCIKRVHGKGHTEIGRRRLCPLCRGPAVALLPVPMPTTTPTGQQEQENRAVLARKFEQLL